MKNKVSRIIVTIVHIVLALVSFIFSLYSIAEIFSDGMDLSYILLHFGFFAAFIIIGKCCIKSAILCYKNKDFSW